jgi:Periplasmic binding protein
MFPPERIVCLTEETVETLYLLGEERRIVGISGYVVRPPRARREKPRVSAFTTADVPKILNLKPDLVLTFSDLQADIAATLIRHGEGCTAARASHHFEPGVARKAHMTLFLIIGAVMLGTITGTLTARRGDLLSLAISLAALLMLVLLAQLGRSL